MATQLRIPSPRIVSFDVDALTETDALYLIDLLSDALTDPDPITNALSQVAYDIADASDHVRGETSTFDAADALYPQTEGIWTAQDRHRLAATRNAYLRRFGMMVGGVA